MLKMFLCSYGFYPLKHGFLIWVCFSLLMLKNVSVLLWIFAAWKMGFWSESIFSLLMLRKRFYVFYGFCSLKNIFYSFDPIFLCWMYKNTKIMSNVSILVVSLRTVYDDINLTPLQLVHSVHKLQLNFDLGWVFFVAVENVFSFVLFGYIVSRIFYIVNRSYLLYTSNTCVVVDSGFAHGENCRTRNASRGFPCAVDD